MLRAAPPAGEREENIVASLLSVIHMNHGDAGWEIYREHSPEMADYRKWRATRADTRKEETG